MLPDGITVAGSPDPDAQQDARRIAVNSPRQFTEERRYLMSVGVTNPSDRNVDGNLLDLISYSLLKQHSAPEPGLLPLSDGFGRAVRCCRSGVSARVDGNPAARSRSGDVPRGKPFPMPGLGE